MASAEHYIGLMSGTSLDGVDAVLLDFSSGGHRIIGEAFSPFEDSLRARLLAIHSTQSDEIHKAAVLGNELAQIYAQAVHQLLSKTRVNSQHIDIRMGTPYSQSRQLSNRHVGRKSTL